MKAFVISEQVKESMLKELELEKVKASLDFRGTPNQLVDQVHRKFVYVIEKHLQY